MSFEKALEVILKHEGGYVNHPRDPGGMTNLGVTKRVWERWVGRDVGEREMRSLTPEKVAPLYYKKYWKKVRADRMPPGLGLQVFDFGVNAGPRRAIRYLQMTVGSKADGIWGPNTKRALRSYVDKYGPEMAIRRYASLRLSYYKRLRHFKTFGRGWTRRTREVRDEGLKWQREA